MVLGNGSDAKADISNKLNGEEKGDAENEGHGNKEEESRVTPVQSPFTE